MESTKEALDKQLKRVTEKIKEQNSKFETFYLKGDADSLSKVFSRNVAQYLPHQPPTVDTGHYIVLWEESDGIWKIVWDAPVTEMPLE